MSEDDIRRMVREEIERAFSLLADRLDPGRVWDESEAQRIERYASENVANALRGVELAEA